MPRRPLPLDPAALARARGALAAATGKRRLDLILDAEDPGALVRALPADELYLTIREIGLADAVALLELATPEQFRTFLDLAAWRGEEVEPRRALPWLRAARAGASASDRGAARWKAKLARLDRELLALLLRGGLRVHDLEAEPDPQLVSDRFLRTPEGKRLVEFLADGAEYLAIRGLVDDLLAENPLEAVRFLESLASELPSELTESALRWRTGRLADLGYPSLEEALSWFARPAGGAARGAGGEGAALPAPAGAPLRPPGFFLQPLGGPAGSLLARGAALLDEGEREHLELELLAAGNAVLVADRVDPGDPEAVRAALAVARANVEMGLEVLASSSPGAAGAPEGAGPAERAREILSRTAVKALFQRGFGRVLELRWRAERLLAAGGAGTSEAPLLDPPLGEVLSALARRRPLYAPAVELPRERWASPEASVAEPRPFLASAEVDRTASALGAAEGLVALAAKLGLARPRPPSRSAGGLGSSRRDPAAPGPGARFDAVTRGAEEPRGEGDANRPAPTLAALYLTARANELLGRPFAPAPISTAELPAAARALLAAPADPRLASEGEAGALLAAMAAARAEELRPLAEGLDVPLGAVSALVVRLEP